MPQLSIKHSLSPCPVRKSPFAGANKYSPGKSEAVASASAGTPPALYRGSRGEPPQAAAKLAVADLTIMLLSCHEWKYQSYAPATLFFVSPRAIHAQFAQLNKSKTPRLEVDVEKYRTGQQLRGRTGRLRADSNGEPFGPKEPTTTAYCLR